MQVVGILFPQCLKKKKNAEKQLAFLFWYDCALEKC